MDVDILIACVFEKTPIWDKRQKLHSNRNVIDKLWKEISNETEQDEQKIRKKWKYLRDQFAVELGKLPRRRSGDPADAIPVCKWPYFKQLFFLKDTVRPRTSTGNLSGIQAPETCIDESQTSVDNSNTTNNNEQSREEVVVETSGNETATSQVPENENTVTHDGNEEPSRPIRQYVTNSTSDITPVTTRKKKRAIDTFHASVLEIENRKLEYLESKRPKHKEPDDEHLLFFKSLLSHVRKIPESKILSFRSAIQGLVQEFQNTETFVFRPTSCSSSSFSAQSGECHQSNTPSSFSAQSGDTPLQHTPIYNNYFDL